MLADITIAHIYGELWDVLLHVHVIECSTRAFRLQFSLSMKTESGETFPLCRGLLALQQHQVNTWKRRSKGEHPFSAWFQVPSGLRVKAPEGHFRSISLAAVGWWGFPEASVKENSQGERARWLKWNEYWVVAIKLWLWVPALAQDHSLSGLCQDL